MDSVNHSINKRRKKEFVKEVVYTDKNRASYRALGGTQSLDGLWSHLQRNTSTVPAKYRKHIDSRIREAQWRHWIGSADRWVEAGRVLAWTP